MIKKDLYITLLNIDENLTNAIHELMQTITLNTIRVNIRSRKDSTEEPVIKVRLGSDSSDKVSQQTLDFMVEYKEFNKTIQKLVFKYMQATTSFIEFEYGTDT